LRNLSAWAMWLVSIGKSSNWVGKAHIHRHRYRIDKHGHILDLDPYSDVDPERAVFLITEDLSWWHWVETIKGSEATIRHRCLRWFCTIGIGLSVTGVDRRYVGASPGFKGGSIWQDIHACRPFTNLKKASRAINSSDW
jgi:hypothetical protein